MSLDAEWASEALHFEEAYVQRLCKTTDVGALRFFASKEKDDE